jgi:hypothetical protein
MGLAERQNPHAKKTEVVLPPDVKDRFERPIGPGDTVHADLPADGLWDVEGVAPNMDPRQPPNTVRVELVRRQLVLAPAHQALVQFLRVRTASEAGRPAPTRMVEVLRPPRSWWQRVLGR